MTTGATRPGDALSDTQRRFLVAVMERVPRAQVHEVYLFAPMKQGSMETGIAVVAIGEPPRVGATDTPPDDAAMAIGDGDPTEAAAGTMDTVTAPDDGVADGDVVGAGTAAETDVTYADATGVDGELQPPAPARAARFTVFTARYRLQLKGPERGKWDVDVVEEADAPLVTVDAVVRGVHRRSGEPSEVERLAPHDLARALGEVPWTSES
ncbi:MAG: hypothetical protein ACYC2G_04135 [Gemmatimonadaceae bacterium]